ncbi:MAG: hypothetical protein WED07_05725 [Candidatus Freyarchaeum deiterrae]
MINKCLDEIKMRTKTLGGVFKKILIVLLLVSVTSFFVLMYIFFFSRVKLLVGLLYLFPAGWSHLLSLGPLTIGLLLSIDYTTLGLIWEGWLVVSTNPGFMLTLELLLLVPLTVCFLLTPIRLFTPLSRVNGYENLGEAVKGFKSLIWSTKEGKRTVISMMTLDAIYCVLILLMLLSGFYIIRQDPGLMVALLMFFGITGSINFLFITPHYQRIRDQKLQVKQGSVKP